MDEFDIALAHAERMGEQRANGLVGATTFGWLRNADLQPIAQRADDLVTLRTGDRLHPDLKVITTDNEVRGQRAHASLS